MIIKKFVTLSAALALVAVASFGASNPVAAQTASPRLQVQLLSTGLTNPLVASSTNATVARLQLNTNGSTEAVIISSLPFDLSVGNGAQASTLTNCRVFNETSPNTALNTPASMTTPLVAGVNNIVLNNPLVLPANTTTVLALRCDVTADLAAGGTFTFSMNTSNIVATGATTGMRAIVTVPGGAVVIPPFVPGIPSTGTGGEAAMNATLLAGSILAGLFGLTYSKKHRKDA